MAYGMARKRQLSQVRGRPSKSVKAEADPNSYSSQRQRAQQRIKAGKASNRPAVQGTGMSINAVADGPVFTGPSYPKKKR